MSAQHVDDPAAAAPIAAALAAPGPGGLQVSRGGLADLAEVAALSARCFGETALSAAHLRRALRQGHALLLLGRGAEGLRVHTFVELNRRQRRVYVVETATQPTARGQGLARDLRDRVDQIGRSLGYRAVASHVSVENTAAIALNTAAGLAITARLPGYYEDGGDAFAFAKRL